MNINEKPFLIQFCPPCQLDRVELTYKPDINQQPDIGTLAQARKQWKLYNQKRKSSGIPPLKNSLLFRPDSIRKNKDRIRVYCGLTSYLATSFLSAPCKGWHEKHLGAGLSIVPVCADGQILIGRRSGIVYQGKHRFHVAAGHAHPKTDFKTKNDTLTKAALQELDEEMAIQAADIQTIEFLGIGLDLTTSKTEFLTRVNLENNADAYMHRWRKTACLYEYREFDMITTLDAVTGKDSLGFHQNKFTVACRIALEAHWECK
ncbi:hypothetical protein JW835_05095 [bacterium]|nr:hypothetical protein [bacterium]